MMKRLLGWLRRAYWLAGWVWNLTVFHWPRSKPTPPPSPSRADDGDLVLRLVLPMDTVGLDMRTRRRDRRPN